MFRFLTFHLFLLLFLNASLNSADAQLRTWLNTSGGLWSDDLNWSGSDIPNTAGETAVIDGTSTFVVSYNLNAATIGGLELSNPNATLNIGPNGLSNSSLTINSGFNNLGSIQLNSDNTGDANLTVTTGTITNSGFIGFGGTSTSSSTLRRLSADIVNNGTISVTQDAQFNRNGGILSNHNSLNISSGKTLSFGSSVATLNQEAGTVNNNGVFVFSGDTLNFNGGSFSGNAIELLNSTLNIGGGSTGAGIFNYRGIGSFSGNVAASQTINVLTNGTSNTQATSTSDIINEGVINLNSDTSGDVNLIRNGTLTNNSTINFGGTSTSSSTLRRITADLINNGTLNVNQDGRLNRAGGVHTNHGTINISAGKLLQFESAVATFNQENGLVNNQGQFQFVSDTLNFNGGDFAGNNINLLNSTLNIGGGHNGTGEFDFLGIGNYSGDLESNQTLNILANGTSNTQLTASGDFTNRSTINLNSDTSGDVNLVRNGTVTNEGTIHFGGTSTSASTLRRITAHVVNHGLIQVNQDARLNRAGGVYTNNNLIQIASGKTLEFESSVATFNQNGGMVDNQGTFRFVSDTLNFNGGEFVGNSIDLLNSNLNIGAGSVGQGTFNHIGIGTYSGDLAADQVLNVVANGTGNTQITAVQDFTNHGLINISSDTSGDAAVRRVGSIINEGQIVFGGSSTSASTLRRLAAQLDNRGALTNQTQGPNNSVGEAGDNHLNSGLIMNVSALGEINFVGSSFVNEVGGTLTGIGRLDFTQTGLQNEGTIEAGLSPGTLELAGLIDLGGTSILKFEIGGTTQGIDFDFINATDTVNLDGSLNIELINGFQQSISSTDSFTILSADLLNGTFAGLADGAVLSDIHGLGTFTINYSNGDVVLSDFQLNAIPEPSQVGFGILLVALVVRRRSRTRKEQHLV